MKFKFLNLMPTLSYFILMMSLLWLPPLIGGDYTSGDWGWNWTRTIALIYIVVMSVVLFLFTKERAFSRRWWGVYLLILASTVLLSFSIMVSAAWVHVAPFSLLYSAVGIVFATALFPKLWRASSLVVATSFASAVYTFGIFVFPP